MHHLPFPKRLIHVILLVLGLPGLRGASAPVSNRDHTSAAGLPPGLSEAGLSSMEWQSIQRQIQADDPHAVLDWSPAVKVTATDGLAGDSFGVSLTLDQDILVVGASGYGLGVQENQGAAYVFYRHQGAPEAWGLVKKLTISDGLANDYFGSAVAVSGDTIVVGAPLEDILGQQNQGAVYVFQRNQGGADQWGQVTKLMNGAAYDQFGGAVAISGNTIIVGAYRASPPGQQYRGAAYIYQGGADFSGQVIPLSAGGLGAYNYFGVSVAISHDIAVVGAYGADVGSTLGAGAAYVFQRNSDGAGGLLADGWGQIHKLSASDGAANARFGWSVAINEPADYIAVGAPNANTEQGAAYVFFRNQGAVADSWDQVTPLTAGDGAASEHFGYAVAISGVSVLAGAPDASVGGNLKQGAAYLFERNKGGESNWGQVSKQTASDGAPNEFFGGAVAISGDMLAAGAWGASVNGKNDQGAAYTFIDRTDSWAPGPRLLAADTISYDRFGSAIAIDGDTLVVGAPGVNGYSGAAYVFARHWGSADQWGQVRKLVASDPQAGDHFGSSVVIHGDTVVIGAPWEDGGSGDPFPEAGAAYIFKRNQGGADNWGQVRKLVTGDAQANDYFGNALTINGDTLVAGAVSGNDDRGAVYIFGRDWGGVDNWGLVKKLVAADAQPDDWFGYSVDLHGDILVVGAAHKSGGPGDPLGHTGAVYVFWRNSDGQGGMAADGWGQVRKLVADDTQAGDYFGMAVALHSDSLIVGAPYENGGPGDPLLWVGAAYLFQRNYGGADQWGQVRKLAPNDAKADDRFGRSVTLHGDSLVVGAFGEYGTAGDPPSHVGAVYIFQRNQGGAEQWGQVKKLVASDAQAGDWFGVSATIHGDTLVVGAMNEDGGPGDPRPDAGAVYLFSALLKADTTTAISSHTPAPSQIDQPVTVSFTVSGAAGASGTPSGVVIVSDGAMGCSAALANGSGSCELTYTSSGVYNLTATYPGDERFNASTSATVAHQVNDPAKSDTTTLISAHTPDPSQIGGSVSIAFTVSGAQGATGTPSGNVTVSDGALICSGALANGSGVCTLTFTTPGVHTLSASYAGDENFNASLSAAVTHTVVAVPSGHKCYLPLVSR